MVQCDSRILLTADSFVPVESTKSFQKKKKETVLPHCLRITIKINDEKICKNRK